MANQGRARLAPISESVVIGKQGRLLYQQSSIYETFTYNLLDTSADCIRLVILEPSATAGGVLRCCLVHVTFGEIPKYEALSYTWGSEALKNAIVIDGKSFLIGDSFWEALVGLQRLAEGRMLYINAIYVNQADISERNQQLRIMPHIYLRAEMQWSDQANGINNLGLEPKSSFQVDHSGKNSDGKDLILVHLYSPENKLGQTNRVARVGLAPPGADIGDFICYLYQNERAIVVRRKIDAFLIIGTALLSVVRSLSREKRRFAVPNDAPLESGKTINIYLDIASVYELSLWSRNVVK